MGMLCGTHSIWLRVKGRQPQVFCCRAGSEDWGVGSGEQRQKKISAGNLPGFVPVGYGGLAGVPAGGLFKATGGVESLERDP